MHFLYALSASFLSHQALAAMCHGKVDQPDYVNLEPIHNQNLQLIDTYHNPDIGGAAKYYRAGEDKDVFNVLHLYGTPYQLGYNHGAIISDQVKNLLEGVLEYMIEEVEDDACRIDQLSSLCRFRPEFVHDVIEMGIDAALDKEIEATDPWTSDHFNQEMQGLADGSGVDLQLIKRIHQLGELTKADCSMFGAWTDALEDGKGLLQVRALDWTTAAIFTNNPQITIYHPENPEENRFANIGFPGWIGLMTGMNDQKMGISEIGASTAGDSPDFPSESRKGQSFTWMLRDVLQFDKTADAGLERMQNTARTCNLILGIGDGKEDSLKFHGIASDAGRLTHYSDYNQEPLYYIDGTDMTHPRINNVVYWGMDWYCAPFHQAMSNQLKANWGGINAENTIRNIIAGTNSGNLHVAVYDYNHDDMYVAFHSQPQNGNSGSGSAFKRSYTRLNMKQIFEDEFEF